MRKVQQKTGRKLRFGRILFMILFCFCAVFENPVSADELPSSGKDTFPETVTLRIIYTVEDAVFHLYRVADFSESAEYVLSGEFDEYRENLPLIHAKDQNGWLAIAETLRGYVAADKDIKPVGNVKIKDGEAVFAPVAPGLYLLIGDPLRKKEEIFHSMPILISLPDGRENGVWKDSVTVDAKPGKSDLTGNTVTYSVEKHWESEPNVRKWADQVQVELLKNGEKMEDGIRTLSAENDWFATWENLEEGADYTLTELDPGPRYTVTVTKMGTRFTVTNKAKPTESGDLEDESETEDETEPVPMSEEAEKEEPLPSGGSAKKGGGTPEGGPGSGLTERFIPKTGDDTPIDRWLVLLTVSGLILILAGYRLEQRVIRDRK